MLTLRDNVRTYRTFCRYIRIVFDNKLTVYYHGAAHAALFLSRTFVKSITVCYHILRKLKEDVIMRAVFKILLAPIWLLLTILKLAFRLAAGAAAFVLAITGGLLLVYDLFLLIIGLGSKELMLQLLTIGGLLIAFPLLAGLMVGLLEAAQEPIKEFIES